MRRNWTYFSSPGCAAALSLTHFASRGIALKRFLAQELSDHCRTFRRPVHQEQVPVVDDVELSVANQPREDLGVDQGHDRVIATMHDQRRLTQGAQPQDAGP